MANPKDCHYYKTSSQYACGTSTGECSLLMAVFFVVKTVNKYIRSKNMATVIRLARYGAKKRPY